MAEPNTDPGQAEMLLKKVHVHIRLLCKWVINAKWNENSSRTMNHKLMHTRHATLHMHAIIILLYVLQGKIRYVHMNDHASTYQWVVGGVWCTVYLHSFQAVRRVTLHSRLLLPIVQKTNECVGMTSQVW